MIEADFVRIFFNQTSNQFTTQDAFQSKRMGCDFLNGGLCSDENHNFKDHVTFMGSAKNLGLAMVDFKRSIMPLDDADSPIPLAGPSQVCHIYSHLLTFTHIYSHLIKTQIFMVGYCCHRIHDISKRRFFRQCSTKFGKGKCDY